MRRSAIKDMRYNKHIVILTYLLILLGIVFIFDASVYTALTVFNNEFHFVIAQIKWIAIGTIVMLVLAKVNYNKLLGSASYAILFLTIVLLIAVLVWGVELNNAKRWFIIGGFVVQPAEFAKISLMLYFSTWMARLEQMTNKYRGEVGKEVLHKVISFMLIIGITGGLILIEPDMGTSIVLVGSVLLMFASIGKGPIHLLTMGLIFGIFGILVILAIIIAPYRFNRFKTFWHILTTGDVQDKFGAGFQIFQILVGIGSGGMWGKGLNSSRQKYGYLVENTAFTDSIIAVILEEKGLIGGIILLALYGMLFYYCIKVSQKAKTTESKLLALGISLVIIIQVLVHFGANLAVFPLTGVPLPLISYGGSSLVSMMAGIGIILSIDKYG